MKFPVVSLLGAVILLRAGEGACGQEPLRAAAFRLPDVPAALTEPAERADYLALHYWDRFDFADTTLVRRPEITEQAFADFVCILPYAPRAGAAVDSLFARAEVAKGMFCHFMELGDKYLDEPASPLYNEELYALFLRAQLDSPLLEEVEKIGPRTRLAVMSKNRPGDRAEDFTFRCRDGSRGRLSEIGAEYTLLYFNAPDCADCRRAKAYLASSSAVAGLLRDKRLAVVSVCIGTDPEVWKKTVCPTGWIDAIDEEQTLMHDAVYDLRTVPAIYLLDRNKRVLLKNAAPDEVGSWLSGR